MNFGYKRSERVADLIKEEMALMLLYELKDPRIQGIITVMEVRVSDDLRHAKIYVSVLGNDIEKEGAMEGLNRAKGFVRRTLGSRLHLKRTPTVDFFLDRRIDAQEQITRLLQSAQHTDKAKQEG